MIGVRAPAKLNVFLRVLGRRPDGYHELETVFEITDWCDELHVAPHPDEVTLTCDDPKVPCGEQNLIMRAARLLRQMSRVRAGAAIHLVKRIPMAAGLGGGSSDAASTLIGLNRLWGLDWPWPRLRELGAQLGSDVPVFLQPEPFALGRGRGERCEPLPSALGIAHVVVVPSQRLSTAEVFAGLRFPLTAPASSSSIVAHAIRNGSLCELASALWNDLEPEAIRRCPVISTIQASLRRLGCLGSMVSGSGSSVFGICRDLEQADDIASRLRARDEAGWRIQVVQTARPPHAEA